MPAVLRDDEAAWSARDRVAYALIASGRPVDAAATARAFPRREPKGPAGWLETARICSRVAESLDDRDDAPAVEARADLIERGLTAMGRALDLGDPPPSRDDLARDERLSALRRPPGYAALLARRAARPSAKCR